MNLVKNHKWRIFPDLLVILFFALYFILGLFLAKDYGIHWDDHAQYKHGLVTADYLNEMCGNGLSDKPFSDTKLEEYKDRAHGVTFQLLALGIQNMLGISDIRSVFLLRHYMTFFVFFIGLIFLYRLLKLHFKNPYIALTGVLFMILSPRIFADSFYNSKDIVFLSLTIISTWTLVKFLNKPSYASVTFHALSSALLISTRIIGVFMPALTLLFIILKYFLVKDEDALEDTKFVFNIPVLRKWLVKAGYYLVLVFGFTVAFWPYLWSQPFGHFIEIFTKMSHFNWDDPVLFRGEFLQPDSLPFYYVPLWIAISTPILYSILFLTGLVFIILNKERNLAFLTDLLAVSIFFFPLLAVIILGSVIYDGWRQMYFLYVPFIIISMKGISELLNLFQHLERKKLAAWLHRFAFMAMLLSFGVTIGFMARNHPNQQVYFNFLAGKEPVKNFEGDYWGLSYRQLLRYLLDNDPSDTINIISVNWPGKANADIFSPEERKRLNFTSLAKARYYISNYRFPVEHDKLINRKYPYDHPLYEIKVKRNNISGIYMLSP